MTFVETPISGSKVIQREPFTDERGSFARFYCEREFRDAGIDCAFRQMNICDNFKRGTLRGLHFQKGGAEEDKVVSCVRGRIFDVLVDIRPESRTFCRYFGCELSEENGKMLFIPKGCAHGYVTLEDNCGLVYLMSEFYSPGASAGYRYDDPAFGIKWPIGEDLIISDKDLNLPYIQL